MEVANRNAVGRKTHPDLVLHDLRRVQELLVRVQSFFVFFLLIVDLGHVERKMGFLLDIPHQHSCLGKHQNVLNITLDLLVLHIRNRRCISVTRGEGRSDGGIGLLRRLGLYKNIKELHLVVDLFQLGRLGVHLLNKLF